MIRSMTGYASAQRGGEWGELVLDLRSVNYRYLDIKMMLPDALRPLEETLRRKLRQGIARGRIEATLRWRAARADLLHVNRELATTLARSARDLLRDLGENAPLDGLRLLAWPGVVEIAEPAIDVLQTVVIEVAEEAIDRLAVTREREGEALAVGLESRLSRLVERVDRLHTGSAMRVAGLRRRLEEGLAALEAEVDADRAAQEAALIIMRQDVSEELDRLGAHAGQMQRILAQGGPIGRRLDFILQELMREANTLANKVGEIEATRMALDLKLLIEEMREQVQNVE